MASAIAYPEEIPADVRAFTFLVDGRDVEAVEDENRLRLTWHLPPMREEGDLARLAGYATGRMLKEEAVLAWDPSADAAILWQDVPVTADGALLRRFFEVFLMSCDWWAARVADAATVAQVPEMVILP